MVTRMLYGHIVWDLHKAIDIVEWSIRGGGCLESLYCVYKSVYITEKRKTYVDWVRHTFIVCLLASNPNSIRFENLANNAQTMLQQS